MTNQNTDLILFVVSCLVLINGASMSLDFLDRMRKRQQKRRRDEQETRDRAAGTHTYIEHVETKMGYLLDETGEPCKFHVDKYNPHPWARREIRKAEEMTQKIDFNAFNEGLIFPVTMLNYYMDIPVLEPVENIKV